MATKVPSRDQAPLRVVGAAIVRDGACFVAQRSAAMSEPMKWEFPGGKIHPDESPERALIREAREELQLNIEVGPWLGRGHGTTSQGRSLVLDVYLATVTGGDLELREHRSCGWYRLEEIDVLDWAAADLPVLPALRHYLQTSTKHRRQSGERTSI